VRPKKHRLRKGRQTTARNAGIMGSEGEIEAGRTLWPSSSTPVATLRMKSTCFMYSDKAAVVCASCLGRCRLQDANLQTKYAIQHSRQPSAAIASRYKCRYAPAWGRSAPHNMG
jgi:hypothetical protein